MNDKLRDILEQISELKTKDVLSLRVVMAKNMSGSAKMDRASYSQGVIDACEKLNHYSRSLIMHKKDSENDLDEIFSMIFEKRDEIFMWLISYIEEFGFLLSQEARSKLWQALVVAGEAKYTDLFKCDECKMDDGELIFDYMRTAVSEINKDMILGGVHKPCLTIVDQ